MQKTKGHEAPPAEQRVLLSGISWKTYESLLEDHLDSSAPRFAYDRGELEIVSPSPEHEMFNRSFSSMLDLLFVERRTDMVNFGSTTFRREDLERGFEPDSCFYLDEKAERMRGRRRLDLNVDPPPDLVLEIDITSPSIDEFPIYANLGVPEVWRYDGTRLEISILAGDTYTNVSESEALPGFSSNVLAKLIEDGKYLKRFEWIEKVQEAARKARI